MIPVDRNASAAETLGVLSVGGTDARSFLQGQLSNDLSLLKPGAPSLSSFNTPQGRVIAVLRLVETPGGVYAILPRAMVKAAIDKLRKYVLRAKVVLTDASDEIAAVPFVSGAIDRVESSPRPRVTFVRLPGTGRAMLLGPRADTAALEAENGARAASDNDWRLAQIQVGEPQIHPETTEQFVAQMLNLDLVEAISFTKGCYTGQEIIARAHHLGRVKRRMRRFRVPGTSSLDRGETIALAGHGSGKVIEWAARPDGDLELLAVVTEGGSEVNTGAGEVSELPLPYAPPDSDR